MPPLAATVGDVGFDHDVEVGPQPCQHHMRTGDTQVADLRTRAIPPGREGREQIVGAPVLSLGGCDCGCSIRMSGTTTARWRSNSIVSMVTINRSTAARGGSCAKPVGLATALRPPPPVSLPSAGQNAEA